MEARENEETVCRRSERKMFVAEVGEARKNHRRKSAGK